MILALREELFKLKIIKENKKRLFKKENLTLQNCPKRVPKSFKNDNF